MAEYNNLSDVRRSATYTYDHADRRIAMSVGGGASGNASNPYAADYQFVYHGDDVVAEYVDKPGSLNDYSRIYWLMPDIDQRIGFIHIDNSGNKEVYYYLTDHQGSVLQVVDESGNVVNQYDYDSFGVINWNNSYEGIENRYKFQGREYDSHAGHYYYRYRTYIPEWGSFTSPDMNLSNGILGEPNGVGNYLFCNNNPVNWRDPRGLWYLQGNNAIAVEGDTLNGLANILGTGVGALPFDYSNRRPESLQIGEAIDVSNWVIPMRNTIAEYESTIEERKRRSRIYSVYGQAILEVSNKKGKYKSTDVVEMARPKVDVLKTSNQIVSTISFAETMTALRATEASIHMITENRKMVAFLYRTEPISRTVKVTKAAKVLGGVSFGLSGAESYRAYKEGHTYEGSKSLVDAGLSLAGIWIPPVAVGQGLFMPIEWTVNYTYGGGYALSKSNKMYAEQQIELFYLDAPRMITILKDRANNLKSDYNNAQDIFEHLSH